MIYYLHSSFLETINENLYKFDVFRNNKFDNLICRYIESNFVYEDRQRIN